MDNATINTALAAYNRANQGEGVQGSVAENISGIPGDPANETGPNFSQLVTGALQSSASAGYNSEAVSTRALAGQADIHELVAAVSGAELTLNTVVAVRDRVVSAYQEIVKMPI